MRYKMCAICNFSGSDLCGICKFSGSDLCGKSEELDLKGFAYDVLRCGSSSFAAERVLNILGEKVGRNIIDRQDKLVQEMNSFRNKSELNFQLDFLTFAWDVINCGRSIQATKNILKILGENEGLKIIHQQDMEQKHKEKNLSYIKELEKLSKQQEKKVISYYNINYKVRVDDDTIVTATASVRARNESEAIEKLKKIAPNATHISVAAHISVSL